MSYSKHWIFPGAVKIWKNIFQDIKNLYYYNKIKDKYYKNKIEIPFKEILSRAVNLWNKIIYSYAFKQTCLIDYG
jgi:hypothetical protein